MRTILLALVLVAPVAASAQKQHQKAAPVQHINIDDPDRIEGETPRGQGDLLTVRRAAKQSSLIKVRADFHAEMMATAAGL